MEYWDACDNDLHLIPGVTLIRGEAIPEGMCHLVCDVIVRHKDGTYLLMQRAPDKKFGGMWEATAGGSAVQSKTPVRCAVRELHEETGILCDDLQQAGQVRDGETLYVEFFCETNCDKESVMLQDGETSAYR